MAVIEPELPIQPTSRRITPRGWKWLIIALFLAGVVCASWKPIWIAPPNINGTWLLYVPVDFAWLIVLIWAALTHRITLRPVSIFLVVIILAVQAVIGFGLLIFFALSVGLNTKCSQSASSTVFYACDAQNPIGVIDCAQGITHYQFVGLQGLPLVIKTQETYDLPKCSSVAPKMFSMEPGV